MTREPWPIPPAASREFRIFRQKPGESMEEMLLRSLAWEQDPDPNEPEAA